MAIFRSGAGVKGKKIFTCNTYRGSYMNAHVLLNLLNELGKSVFISFSCNEFNKFNTTRARMLDSIYHMTFRLL